MLRGSAHTLTSDLLSPQLHSGSSEAEEENDPDGAYAFRRKAGCQYFSVSSSHCENSSCGCKCSFSAPAAGLNALCNCVHPVRVQARQDRVASWPWCPPWEDGLAEVRYRYSLTTLTVPRRCLGMARRRVGRGGRSVHFLCQAASYWSSSTASPS